MDILVKHFHLIFLGYAIMIGLEKYDLLTVSLEEQRSVLDSMEVKLRKATRDLREVKQFKADLEKSKEKVKQVVENIERIQRQLPSEINDTEVNATLVEFSRELKMLQPEPTPKEEINNKFYYTRVYDFKVKGTYLQLLIFFEKLENLAKRGRILNVRSIKVVHSEDADPRSRFKILELEASIEAYRYNTNFDIRDL